jgi:hypothetical protein
MNVMEIIRDIPEFWKDFLRGPTRALEKRSGKGGLEDALILLLLIAAINLAVYFLRSLPFFQLGTTFALVDIFSDMGRQGFQMLMLVVSFFLFVTLVYAVSKFVGSKSSFGNHAHLMALTYTVSLIAIALQLILGVFLSGFPYTAIVAMIELLLLCAFIFPLKVAHKFSWSTTLSVVVVSFFVLFILFYALMLITNNPISLQN